MADLTALLKYLDACDAGNGVVIVGIRKIERGVRLEVSRRNNHGRPIAARFQFACHGGQCPFCCARFAASTRSSGATCGYLRIMFSER